MRVAIYGRVSTSHQVDHQTIEQQLERLSAHVRAHAAEGWMLDPAHVFRDDGYSGAMLARPGLDHLRDAVKNHEVDHVLVTAPDRLARNYVHQMVLLEEWGHLGCAAEFLDRPMSDDPHDHLLLQIRGAVAEYERTLLSGGSPVAGREELDQSAIRLEEMYLGLRTRNGVPEQQVSSALRTPWIGSGWAELQGGRIRLTPEGWLRLDALAASI